MSGTKYYAGAIWTNHALERLYERDFTQAMAGEAFMHPDQTRPGRETGSTHYSKRFGQHTVSVIAKRTDRGEWLILSTWINPPIAGTKDEQRKKNYHSYQRASAWGKTWRLVLRQLGLIQW